MGVCKKTTKKPQQVFDASNAYFGMRHCRIITFTDDTAGDQDGSQFDLNAINEEYEQAKYLVWLSTDTLSGAPTPATGVTLVPVEYDSGDSATVISGKVKAALDALDPALFNAEVENDTLHVLNKFLGLIDEEDYLSAGDISMEVGVLGFGGSLGSFAEGGAVMDVETEKEIITADQTGDTKLDAIYRSFNVSISMTLVEMTKDRWEQLIGKVAGGIVEVGSEKLIGYGTDKIFKSELDVSGMLVLHPVRLPAEDRSQDKVLLQTSPDLSSINFSGSEKQGAEFVFEASADLSVNSKINLFVLGDYTLL